MKERPVLESIIAEIHRRAEKEWANDGYDFEVTITADEYKALCEEEAAISALQTQPAKAQVPDEREAFEAWAMSTPTMYHPNLARHSELSDDYDDLHIQAAWDAWQARSTLTASPAPGSQLEDTEQ